MVVVVRSRRTIRAVIIIVPIVFILNRCVMIVIRIATMLDLSTRSRKATLRRQQTPSEPGKNAEHQKPCHKSRHAAKKHRFPLQSRRKACATFSSSSLHRLLARF